MVRCAALSFSLSVKQAPPGSAWCPHSMLGKSEHDLVERHAWPAWGGQVRMVQRKDRSTWCDRIGLSCMHACMSAGCAGLCVPAGPVHGRDRGVDHARRQPWRGPTLARGALPAGADTGPGAPSCIGMLLRTCSDCSCASVAHHAWLAGRPCRVNEQHATAAAALSAQVGSGRSQHQSTGFHACMRACRLARPASCGSSSTWWGTTPSPTCTRRAAATPTSAYPRPTSAASRRTTHATPTMCASLMLATGRR